MKKVKKVKKSILNLILAIYLFALGYIFLQLLQSIAFPISAVSLYNWLVLVMGIVLIHFLVYLILQIVKVVIEKKVAKIKESYENKQ